MHLKNGMSVRRLPDNKERGYGPSYVSDRYGYGRERAPLWLCYVADSFWPAMYAFRCESLEEAHEHAQEILIDDLDESFLSEEEKAELELLKVDNTMDIPDWADITASGRLIHAEEQLMIQELRFRNGVLG